MLVGNLDARHQRHAVKQRMDQRHLRSDRQRFAARRGDLALAVRRSFFCSVLGGSLIATGGVCLRSGNCPVAKYVRFMLMKRQVVLMRDASNQAGLRGKSLQGKRQHQQTAQSDVYETRHGKILVEVRVQRARKAYLADPFN